MTFFIDDKPTGTPTITEVRERIHWLDELGGERSVQFILAALGSMSNVHGYQTAIIEEVQARLASTNRALESDYFSLTLPWPVDKDCKTRQLNLSRVDGAPALMSPLTICSSNGGKLGEVR